MKFLLSKTFVVVILFLLGFCISLTPKKSEMGTAQGKITESYVEKKFKYRSVYLGHNDFIAHIKYEYEVDGKLYSSEKIEYKQPLYNSTKKAEAILEPYPVGKEVTVYYRKENPTEAYLKVEDDSKEEDDE